MGIFGNISAFNGLGKPSIKLEFEDNEALLDFQRRMQEGGELEGIAIKDFYTAILSDAEKITPKKFSYQLLEKEFGKDKDGVYDIVTPVGTVKFFKSSLFERNRHILSHIDNYFNVLKPTLTNPTIVFESENKGFENISFVKPFSINGKNKIVMFSAVEPTTYKLKTIFEPEVEDKNYIWRQYKKGGEKRLYTKDSVSSFFETDTPQNDSLGDFVFPFEVVNVLLPCIITENGSKSFVSDNKKSLGAPGDTYIITDTRTRARKDLQDTAALKKYDIQKLDKEGLEYLKENDPLQYEQLKSDLDGYGDYYTVRDMRKRARKEPGDLTANKNLQFTKDDDRKMINFDSNLYELTNGVRSWGYAKILKDTNWRALTVKHNSVSGKYITSIYIYFPNKLRRDLDKLTFAGYAGYVDVYVDINKLYNYSYDVDSRHNIIDKQRLLGFVKDDYYKSLFIDAIKSGYKQLQQSLIIKQKNLHWYSPADIAKMERFIKYYKMLYSAPSKYDLLDIKYEGNFNDFRDKIVLVLGKGGVDLNGLGRTANNALYNNLDILDYRGMRPTYKMLDSYDRFFSPAANKNSLKGFGLDDTKKLIADTCRSHYKECAAIARHLKGDCKMQSAFNLWHWLHHNIRYEYDRDGREEVRTPLRVWADRRRGVDCDCLSVFAWCVLKCMGYNPAFELAAFRGKPAFSHIYVNLDGIVIDRVWFIFNSRPPLITKRELFEVGMLDNLGQLF